MPDNCRYAYEIRRTPGGRAAQQPGAPAGKSNVPRARGRGGVPDNRRYAYEIRRTPGGALPSSGARCPKAEPAARAPPRSTHTAGPSETRAVRVQPARLQPGNKVDAATAGH